MSRIDNKHILERLNGQIQKESEAAFAYLAKSAWCSKKGLEFCAEFFKDQYLEELEHMMKIYNYLQENFAETLSIPSVSKPKEDFSSIMEVLETALEHEKSVTDYVNQTILEATKINDFATLEFLRWFVVEQQEEESLFHGIIDRFKLIGVDKGEGLHLADKFMRLVRAEESK